MRLARGLREMASITLVCVLALVPGCRHLQAEQTDPRCSAAAEFVNLLAKGEFSEAAENFDAKMQEFMPPETLQQTWESVVVKTGPFQEQLKTSKTKRLRADIVAVTCRFEKATLDVCVVFDRAEKISGLWFAPAGSAEDYKPPDYAKQGSYQEREVTVGSGLWRLPGTLTLPKGDGPFPTVVLVHGSGPNDRDETIGPNKPFCDLAWGLASRGVAVLRYEKRTKEHTLKMALLKHRLTVKEETIDDALAAAALLRKTPKIDPKRVFVLGHSLGGMLIPRLGKRDQQIAGFIVLAGSTRPFEDILLDQYQWLFSLDGKVSEDEQQELDKLKAQIARVKDPQLSPETPAGDLPLNVPAAYWLDLRGYDPPEVAKTLNRPMFILHGGRDYQVIMQDYEGWKQALSDRPDVQMKIYPKCNHLLIEGEGPSTPAEYQTPGHITEAVIRDIADWIHKR